MRLILGREARCFYWRTNQGADVDLVIERHGQLVSAVEIKAKRRIASADLSGIRSFAEAHPSVPRLVVSEVPEAHDIDGVTVLPWRVFLDRIEEWL